MASQATLQFAQKIFAGHQGRILDVGGLNVNGSIKSLGDVWSVDMREGKGVDEVVNGCDLIDHYGIESWDNVAAMTKGRHNYPNDYWRMELGELMRIFKGQQIIGKHAEPVSIGVGVIKKGPLQVDLNTIKVKAVD